MNRFGTLGASALILATAKPVAGHVVGLRRPPAAGDAMRSRPARVRFATNPRPTARRTAPAAEAETTPSRCPEVIPIPPAHPGEPRIEPIPLAPLDGPDIVPIPPACPGTSTGDKEPADGQGHPAPAGESGNPHQGEEGE